MRKNDTRALPSLCDMENTQGIITHWLGDELWDNLFCFFSTALTNSKFSVRVLQISQGLTAQFHQPVML